MPTAPPALKQTSLNATHHRLHARMVEFGGWEMPIQYSGILEEHRAVRERVGLFDVSHMGEIEIRGSECLALVEYATTNSVARLESGQAQYSALLYEHGGFVDDILVHKIASDHIFICVNAANQEKDYRHIVGLNRWSAQVEFASERYAQLALQGPKALATLSKITDIDLSILRHYHFTDGRVSGADARIARTGYTGEDGFELYIAPDHAEHVWNAVLEAGQEFGILPCGLGARNTLRLEAKFALYGHEIDASITPFEADLGWIVKMDDKDFHGKAALAKQRAADISRKLVGFEMTGRGIARDGYEVLVEGAPAGWVTSGGPSPSFGKNIGLCYLPVRYAQPGVKIEILIRNQPVDAITVTTPFYKRAA